MPESPPPRTTTEGADTTLVLCYPGFRTPLPAAPVDTGPAVVDELPQLRIRLRDRLVVPIDHVRVVAVVHDEVVDGHRVEEALRHDQVHLARGQDSLTSRPQERGVR